MSENRSFILACCLLWAAVLAIACVSNDSDLGFVLTLFVLPVTFIGWIVLCIIAGVQLILRQQLPLSKRIVPFYFLFVPVAAWGILGSILSELRARNTWLVIKASDFHGSENVRFARDGTYSRWRESPLGASDKVGGHYQRRDSLLVLRPAPDDQQPPDTLLVIRPYRATAPHFMRTASLLPVVPPDSLRYHTAYYVVELTQ